MTLPGAGDYNPTTGTSLVQALQLLGFLYESNQDNMVALAGGAKSGATQVSTELARFTTVATSGDSALLPPSVAGLTIFVVNHGANPMTVYGAGTDTVDDIATGTGVSQMASSIVIYSCVTAGKWYSEGLANGFAGGLQTVSSLDSVATAGTTQGNATVLPPRMAYNITSGPANGGVLLPPSVGGAELVVNNNTAATTYKVYGNGSDTINGGASVTLAANTPVIFYCFTAGAWFTK